MHVEVEFIITQHLLTEWRACGDMSLLLSSACMMIP